VERGEGNCRSPESAVAAAQPLSAVVARGGGSAGEDEEEDEEGEELIEGQAYGHDPIVRALRERAQELRQKLAVV
jgi:hypothetical protein